MTSFRTTLLVLLVSAVAGVHSSEAAESLQSDAGDSSFSMDAPEGWTVRKPGGSYQLGELLFDLSPSSTNVNGRIVIVYYPGKVPIVAQRYIEGLTFDGNMQLPNAADLPAWITFGKYGKRDGKVGTVYCLLGGGTLVADLSRRAIDDYDQSEKALLAMLRSFKELGKSK